MAYIKLDSVSLSYPLYETNARSLKTVLLHRVGGGLGAVGGRMEVHALDNISLTLSPGDRLAVVGHNGAGKSTLLKVLSGVYETHIGKVMREGRVSAITDASLGLDLEATGTDNIISHCVFQGMTYAEARARLPAISE